MDAEPARRELLEGPGVSLRWRDRLGFWLERWIFPDWIFGRILYRYDGETPRGDGLYVNRVNGHLVVVDR